MKSIFSVILVIIFIGNIFSQVENKSLKIPERSNYSYEYLNFAGTDGGSRVDIFVQVPFQEVQFIKTANGYEGGYSVTVSIYDENGGTLMLEKMWNEKIVTSSFDASSSTESYNISYRSLKLEPGNYYIKNTIMDKDSRREFTSAKDFTVKDFSAKPVISDIMIVAQKTKIDEQSKIVPNVTGNVSGNESGVNIYFEVYSDSTENYVIAYTITNTKDEVVFSGSDEQTVEKDVTQVYQHFDDLDLGLGRYTLEVKLLDKNGDEVATSRKEFVSRWKGLPVTVDDIDNVIEQVIYIATPEEMAYMRDGKDENEKTQRFLKFWKSKDPSPGNDENEVFEEYFLRVLYATENFSHYVEGWRSDRGQVFITLGAPDNIDRHPFEYDSKPYEIWQYYDLNRSFTFVDYTGFGDYRLITPIYGDMFRYRY